MMNPGRLHDLQMCGHIVRRIGDPLARGARAAPERGAKAAALQIPSNDNAPGNCFRGRFASYTSKRL